MAVLAAGLLNGAAAQVPGGASSFRVGAAKVDVTPAERELPANSYGVLDRLYARAIVLDNGKLDRRA